MTRPTIGYMVVDGQISKGRSSSNNLFTGGVLVPEGAKPGLIYSKLNDDLFKRNGSITAIDNEDDFTQSLKNLHEILYEKGASSKYVNMQEVARVRFDAGQWWEMNEIIALRDKIAVNNKKQDKAMDTTPSVPSLLISDKKNVYFHDKTDIGSELTLSEGPEDGKINVKVVKEDGEDITIVINADNLQESGIVEDPCGAIKTIVKLVPKLLEANINLKNEVIKERKKSADMNDDIFNTNSRLIANLSEISALKEEALKLKIQLEDKDAGATMEDEQVPEDKSLRETVAQIQANTEKLLKMRGNSNQTPPSPDSYNDIINSLPSTMEIYLSDKSRDRLTNCKYFDLSPLTAPNGPLKLYATEQADGESFIGSVADRAKTTTKAVAIFLLETPRNLAGKQANLRKLKLVGFVEMVQLLIEVGSREFKSVVVALLPSQGKDRAEALEIEEALMKGANSIDVKVKMVNMNTTLDVSKPTVLQMTSQSGRARGLSIVRTLADILTRLSSEMGDTSINPCIDCGALCEENKCMVAKLPTVEEEIVEVEEVENPKMEEAKMEKGKTERGDRPERHDRYERPDREGRFGKKKPSACWVCGGRTDKHPHIEGRPCKSIGISCTVCGRYGHQASCHEVEDKEAQETLSRKHGPGFLFMEAGSSKKRTLAKVDSTKEAKRAKKTTSYKDLESDED